MICKGKILAVKGNLFKAEVDSDKLKPGMQITVKTGKPRSVSQNAFLWVYYTYLCEKCDLWKDHCLTPEGIHSAMKKYFLSQKELKGGKFKVFLVGSSTDLTKVEFAEFLEKVDMFICSTFNVDTSGFFATYQNTYANFE